MHIIENRKKNRIQIGPLCISRSHRAAARSSRATECKVKHLPNQNTIISRETKSNTTNAQTIGERNASSAQILLCRHARRLRRQRWAQVRSRRHLNMAPQIAMVITIVFRWSLSATQINKQQKLRFDNRNKKNNRGKQRNKVRPVRAATSAIVSPRTMPTCRAIAVSQQ
jgi:hypothetical protein